MFPIPSWSDIKYILFWENKLILILNGYIKKVLPQKRLVDLLVDQLSSDFTQPDPWEKDVLRAVSKQQSFAKKRSWAKKCLKEDSLRNS